MPIVDEIKIFFPPTIELLLLSLISAFVVGVPLGIFGGLNHHSGSDKCIYTFCLLSTSIPVYWSSQILILFFCVYNQIRFASVSGFAAYSNAVSRVMRFSFTRRSSSPSMEIMFLSAPP